MLLRTRSIIGVRYLALPNHMLELLLDICAILLSESTDWQLRIGGRIGRLILPVLKECSLQLCRHDLCRAIRPSLALDYVDGRVLHVQR